MFLRARRHLTRAFAVALAAAWLPGCAPADYGTIDMEKSKAIAAESGIGPGAGPGAAKKKGSRPTARPSAPTPK